MARFAKEYGFSNVAIETFPRRPGLSGQRRRAVDDRAGEPQAVRHPRCRAGARPGDADRRRVRRARGRRRRPRRRISKGRISTGKVILSSSGLGVFAPAAQRGAVGIIGYTALRPNDYPDQIPGHAVRAAGGCDAPTFGWAVEPRVGRELALQLARGQKITIRSIVKARDGARTSWRSFTRRFPATAARRRRSRSPGICTRATSSRAPTTTTPDAR